MKLMSTNAKESVVRVSPSVISSTILDGLSEVAADIPAAC